MPICFSSKILLFGEHSVIKGSNALAVPFGRFKGCWAEKPGQATDERLLAFCKYLMEKAESDARFPELALDRMELEITEGLFFSSNIPQGYGLGSSGALTAGVMDRYGQHAGLDLAELKGQLGQMERFFHGSSSGTDPLVSLIREPLLISPTGVEKVQAPSFSEDDSPAFFLLDSKQSRQTTPWVRRFLTQYEEQPAFGDEVNKHLMPLANQVIDHFLTRSWAMFVDSFGALSDWQFQYMRAWVPPLFLDLWQLGLGSGDFKLKLCGAGGGGFLLGITKNWEWFKDSFQSQYTIIRL